MPSSFSHAEVATLRARWDTPEGMAILQRLYAEKIDLPALDAGMKAVRSAFLSADFRGADFSNRELMSHFLLFELDLSHALFVKSMIRGSFQASTLVGCSFDEARIVDACFLQANLCNASFANATLDSADFEGAVLDGASFEGLT